MHPLRGDIDRVAGRAIGGQQFADFRLDRRRQFRHLQPLQRDGVSAPDAGATGNRENGDAVALGHRVRRQDRRNGDGFVEIVGDDKAEIGEHRIISRRPSGHARGMGGGGAFAGAGAADLGHDHRLADLGGAARGGDELVHVADALDEQQDNVGRGILHHVVEEFAGAQIRLVAGADHVAQGDAERLGAVVDGKSDPAALRDDAYPPGARDQPLLIGLDVDCRTKSGGDALELVVKSFRIRAGDPHAGVFCERSNGVLHRRAVATLFREARGDNDRVLDPNSGTLFESTEHRAGGNDHDRQIDRLPDIHNRRINS